MKLPNQQIGITLSTTLFLAAIGLAEHARAATYYVRSLTGSDTNSGSSTEFAWATISKANRSLTAGDTVIVAAGTYDERVSPASSGAPGKHITYAAEVGARPVIRHVNALRKNYIRVIGFEITHNSMEFVHGITLYGSHHCEILRNYIHHTRGQGIRNNAYYGDSNYNVVRANVITYTGCPTGVAGGCVGANAIKLQGHHNLFEYNDISHPLDFIDTYGGYTIIRNNYFHDFRNTDFPDGSGDAAHVDIWQPYGIAGQMSDRNMFENNWAADNLEANSHFNQVRDETESGEKEFIIRGNVGLRQGSYVAQFGAIDYVRMYNNTFADFFHIHEAERKGWSTIGFNSEHGTDASTNNFVFNNIFYRTTRPATEKIISIQAGSSADTSHNACEESGSDPSCSVTSDVRFVDYSNDDFHLQESSKCNAAGRAMTTVTSATGNGNSFTVVDAGFFTDGYGIAEGDSIRVGAQSQATIANINYDSDTIDVDTPISWAMGDSVVLAHQPPVPAIGAYEVKSDYSYHVQLERPAEMAFGVRRLVATVTNPDNVRFVKFYIDGLPVSTDGVAPYTYAWSVEDVTKTYTLEAIAYARFAGKTLSRRSTLLYSDKGDSVLPAPPGDLRVQP